MKTITHSIISYNRESIKAIFDNGTKCAIKMCGNVYSMALK
jgi:hypothetical protein